MIAGILKLLVKAKNLFSFFSFLISRFQQSCRARCWQQEGAASPRSVVSLPPSDRRGHFDAAASVWRQRSSRFHNWSPPRSHPRAPTPSTPGQSSAPLRCSSARPPGDARRPQRLAQPRICRHVPPVLGTPQVCPASSSRSMATDGPHIADKLAGASVPSRTRCHQWTSGGPALASLPDLLREPRAIMASMSRADPPTHLPPPRGIPTVALQRWSNQPQKCSPKSSWATLPLHNKIAKTVTPAVTTVPATRAHLPATPFRRRRRPAGSARTPAPRPRARPPPERWPAPGSRRSPTPARPRTIPRTLWVARFDR